MLYALHHFPSGKTTGVKTPRLHLFLRDANTQVLEDFQGTTDLKNIVVSNSDFKAEVAASVGYRMGSWLRRFHDWSTSPNMHINRLGGVKIGHNEPMRQLKYDITYGSILKILGNNFPDLLEGFRPALEEVVDEATKKFETILSGDRAEDKNWGLIHGDFWSGKYVMFVLTVLFQICLQSIWRKRAWHDINVNESTNQKSKCSPTKPFSICRQRAIHRRLGIRAVRPSRL